MRLTSLTYRENSGTQNGANPWELTDLSLDQYNLIVGKNATGKTRIISVIHNLARMIQSPQYLLDGRWSTAYTDESNQTFSYIVEVKNRKVLEEHISLNGKTKLSRSAESTELYSEMTSEAHKIAPPNDRLVLHVRRDKDEFPFLELLTFWASGVKGFAFANTSPNVIEILGSPLQLTSLNAVPSAFEQLSNQQIKKVLDQLEDMGFSIENVSTGLVEGHPPATKMIFLTERGLPKPLKQFEISQGMFRAFALLTIIEFLQSQNTIGAILVDDLGEGLDFDRSRKLAQHLFTRTDKSKIQFITTSNDSNLINAVPLKDVTVCYRSNHTVHCSNYANSKDKFDHWQQLGLNNFDLLTSNFLLE